MKLLKLVLALVVPGLVALFLAVMLMVAYPNSMKVAAPFLCPDDKPDTFVVRYNVQTSDGTGTNFTLFCMSERGEIEEAGTWPPLLVLGLVVGAVLYGLVVLTVLLRVLGRLFRGGDRGSDPPLGGQDASFEGHEGPLGRSGDAPFEPIPGQQGPIIS